MLAPTCSTMISSDEPRCQGLNQSRIQFPLSSGIVLARDSIVGIADTLFNLVTGKSLYSFRNTSSRDQPLGHIVHIMMMSYRVGPEIPLRLHGVTKSQSRFVPTQQTLSEIPVVYLYSHPVTL